MLKPVVVMLLGLSLLACGHKPKEAEEIRYVKVFTLADGTDLTQNTFHGIVHAEFEPNLSFRVTGKIIQRKVDVGQQVAKGTVLASLDPTDYRLSEDSSVAQLSAAQANYVTQKANLGRYKQLLGESFVSQSQYDTQKAQYDSAKAQYEQAQNQLANNQNQVRYTTLLAPASGVISSISMDAGQVVTAGTTVATMAVSGNQEVEVELPEAQVNNYRAGMLAQIKIWATDQVYRGKVRIINQASDQQTRTFTARVTILNPDEAIKYGMAADVTLQPLNATQGIVLPVSSLYTKNGKSYVWVLDDKLIACQVEVKLLATNGNTLKIAPNPALKGGDKVVSAGADSITAGQELKIYGD